MIHADNHTPPAATAPSAHAEPQAAPPPGGPLWLVFCVMACSAFAALLGRLSPFSLSPSSNPYDDSPDALSADHPFAILFHLIANDWFRRSRSAPATAEQLLRRSPVAQAVLNQPLAPVRPCDLPGEPPATGGFAPAFMNQLAAAPVAPLTLASTSFLSAFYAALSPRSRAICDDEANPDASASFHANSAINNLHSAISIPHSAFPLAPG